jgi:phosphogluconate dehydratase
MPAIHPKIAEVVAAIEVRSAPARTAYEARMRAARREGPARAGLACSNLAHVFAAAEGDKGALQSGGWPNIAIVTAYNDMLSSHQPLETYPALIKAAVRAAGATAQVAGGVPAMCDGVTQGHAGMELSLFSRDVIAMATAISLSHDAFDGAILLGVCDKIVPGLFMGVAAFGHLPVLFCPSGPMPSGATNAEKAAVRQRYAAGAATREELLASEAAAYHAPGTCTFYGTANTNQMCMEMMGLHVPGSAFVNPGTPLRKALTEAAAVRAAHTTALGKHYAPFFEVASAKAFVNALVGLMATGGSTNHTLHLVAMARAVGLTLTWEDFDAVSEVTPLLARVYPNGAADVNHWQAAGGPAFTAQELIKGGLLQTDVKTVWGGDLHLYAKEPWLQDGVLAWRDPPHAPLDRDIVRSIDDPFSSTGGLKLLTGDLGRGVTKISAVKGEHQRIEAPARVFDSQEAVEAAYREGRLTGDFVCVVRFQGPKAIGMPELHKLTPLLANLQDRGQKVALLTDGRMSGASGKVLAAIHLSPEAVDGGPIGRLRDGDLIRIDAVKGEITAKVEGLMQRPAAQTNLTREHFGVGRELFGLFRGAVGTPDTGASAAFG